MDKVSDTPRTNFVAHETGDAEWNRSMNRFGRMFAHACILERELTAQKEYYRVLEEEMLVLGDERLCATLDAKENMEIADEFKCLMEKYRQREAEANKALRVAAGLLSTMPQFSNMHLDDVLEKILEETREKK